jgi:hypothetical protein
VIENQAFVGDVCRLPGSTTVDDNGDVSRQQGSWYCPTQCKKDENKTRIADTNITCYLTADFPSTTSNGTACIVREDDACIHMPRGKGGVYNREKEFCVEGSRVGYPLCPAHCYNNIRYKPFTPINCVMMKNRGRDDQEEVPCTTPTPWNAPAVEDEAM